MYYKYALSNECCKILIQNRRSKMKQLHETIPIEHLENFLDAIEDSEYKALFLLILFCGMSWTEICHLRWQSIDFDKRTITAGGKSQKSRVIEVGDDVIQALRERQAYMKKNKRRIPKGFNSYVFLDPLFTGFLEYEYTKAIVKEYGKQIRRYDISLKSLKRAFCMYYLAFNDLDVPKLCEVIGKSMATVMDLYVEGSRLVQADSRKRIQEYKDSPVIQAITAVKLVKL